MFLVRLKLRVKVGKPWGGRQFIIAAVDFPPTLGNVGLYGGVIGRFGLGHAFAALHRGGCGLLHIRKGAMQLQIGDKLMQQHSPLFLVRFYRFLALGVQQMVFPIRIVLIVGVVFFNMVYQAPVAVAKVLPPLVVVGLAVKDAINGKLRLVIAGACKLRFVKGSEKGICAGKGHGFTLPQLRALAPNNRNGRLGGKVGCRFLRRFALFWQIRSYIVGRLPRIIRRIVRGDWLTPLFKTGLWLLLLGGLLPRLLQLRKVSVNAVYNLGGGGADCFKGRFQLRKLPPAAPPSDVAKGVVGRIKPVVLADGVRHTFGLYLPCAAVWPVR